MMKSESANLWWTSKVFVFCFFTLDSFWFSLFGLSATDNGNKRRKYYQEKSLLPGELNGIITSSSSWEQTGDLVLLHDDLRQSMLRMISNLSSGLTCSITHINRGVSEWWSSLLSIHYCQELSHCLLRSPLGIHPQVQPHLVRVRLLVLPVDQERHFWTDYSSFPIKLQNCILIPKALSLPSRENLIWSRLIIHSPFSSNETVPISCQDPKPTGSHKKKIPNLEQRPRRNSKWMKGSLLLLWLNFVGVFYILFSRRALPRRKHYILRGDDNFRFPKGGKSIEISVSLC